MADVVFVAIVIAFFAVAVLLVRACDRIIGADAAVGTGEDVELADREKAAA